MRTHTKIALLGGLALAAIVWRPLPTSVAQDASAVVAGTYVGSKSCKKCHSKQHKSWSGLGKANALQILAPGEKADAKRAHDLDPATDYRQDARCVECHVTGLGQPGGFDPSKHIAADPDGLGGVGCESCHGPAGGWLGDGKHDKNFKDAAKAERMPALLAAGFVPEPKAEDCQRCHNDRSPTFEEFDFEQRKDDRDGIHEHKS